MHFSLLSFPQKYVAKKLLKRVCTSLMLQTYLEQNEGPGLQHLAIKTNDIFTTLRYQHKYRACCENAAAYLDWNSHCFPLAPLVPHSSLLREMQSRSHHGGFEFMPRPSDKYYRELPKKIGNMLTPEQYKASAAV
jgi:4-hydroxyphenylpyruvate dioxygenase